MVTKQLNKKFRLTGLNKAIVILVILLGTTYLATYLNTKEIIHVPTDIILFIKGITYISTIFLIATVIIRISIHKIFNLLDEVEPEHKLLISKAYSILIYSIGVLIILWRLGLSIQNVTLMAGFIATGLAFAIRDVIMSYLAWLILLTKKPFRIGDNIRIGGEEGKVMHIGTFYVIIDDNPEEREEYKRIPNRVFLEKTIHNFGPKQMKYEINTPVSMIPKNTEKICKMIIQAVKKETKTTIKLYLESDNEHTYMYSVFRCDFSKKHEVKNSIVKHIYKHFHK